MSALRLDSSEMATPDSVVPAEAVGAELGVEVSAHALNSRAFSASTMHSSTPCACAAGSARSGCPARNARMGVVYGRAVGSSADATAAKARRWRSVVRSVIRSDAVRA